MKFHTVILACWLVWAVTAQVNAQTKNWFLDVSTGEVEYYESPLKITDVKWEHTPSSSRFYIAYDRHCDVSVDAVYTVEIHFSDFIIVYSHNYSNVPGACSESGVDVIERYGSRWIGYGEAVWHISYLEISVPFSVPETPTIVIMRYLPSQASLERASGGLFASVASYYWIKRNLRGVLPGWPISNYPRFQQQQQLPTIIWERGQVLSPPTHGDRPRLGDRLPGGILWPRDISTIPDDGAVRLPGNKLIEWGLEQGWYPSGGFDQSDAWVGIVGIDHNGDGQLQPSEIIGVIGRCEPGVGADNDFYVDERGYVHWINYDRDGNKVRHYIYDPTRNILKIFDDSGNLIYQGPPWWWN